MNYNLLCKMLRKTLQRNKILYNFYSSDTAQIHTAKTVSAILKTPEFSNGDEVEIKGWVRSVRKLKNNIFVNISDGSTSEKLQIIIPKSITPKDLNVGTSVIVKGIVSHAPHGQLEVKGQSVDICGKCDLNDGYPFLPRKSYPAEYVRQYLHLRPRTNTFSALLRIRSEMSLAIHQYFNSEGYVNVHVPILTSNDCEGAGEVFKVLPDNDETVKEMAKENLSKDEAYFDRKAYLTVSGQLHLEAAVHGLSKVYAFGPTFRAENSRSRLHLSEFYMLEAEIAFVNKIEQLIDIVEKLVKNVTEIVVNKSADDILICRDTIDHGWIHKQFPVLTYEEGITILDKNRGKYHGDFNEKFGFTKEHEMFLVKHCGNVPTFIINWPKATKPFYMRECDADCDKVSALDLLAANVGELVGGSLRENNYDRLKERLPQTASTNLDWYLELRKFGAVPTAGYGLGFERFLQLILGINNIKDTLPFPRWPHNCSL